MITKSLYAVALGIRAGVKVTTWLLRDDIKQGKKILNKMPVIKDYDIVNPIVKKEQVNDKASK
tara:strand:+ start:627 stop:815 length:189 start_codon:yes stop_codon:yes gene_type:complete